MTVGPATFGKLPWRERWLLIQSALLLPLTAAALRVVPLRHLHDLVDRPSAGRRATDLARANRTAHMVAAAAEYGPYRASCLPQSLVLQFMLRRDGMRGELKYGVRRMDNHVTAHCWIELDGEPLIDSSEVRRQFAVLEPASAQSRCSR